MFKLLLGEIKPEFGKVVVDDKSVVAIARQVVPRDQLELSVREFFETAFDEKDYQLDKKAADALREV